MSPATRIGLTPAPEPRPGEEPRTPRTQGALALDPHRMVWGPPGTTPDERTLRRLAQALAEVLAGRRPPETLADRLTDHAYRDLVRAGRMLPAGSAPFAGSVHGKEPRDGVIEMCALVHCGDRNHVLAVRVERRGVQWLCTDFETA
ncbi:Rv3235 family protein [Nonomuraea candida]|uniref:Rv3235 family protein n=1 Tax=Nonomuraea candida TaxID=359159 RepID=UPI0005BC0ADA|nr:Rv3235 family protein [Nonomuraea candida]